MRDWLPPHVSRRPGAEPSSEDGRLPKTVKPRHYEVFLDPELEQGTYSGYVKIEIEIVESTRLVVLHSVDLDIGLILLQRASGLWEGVVITSQPEDETITLTLKTPLDRGDRPLLLINFKGSLDGGWSGFYRGSYKTETGTEKWYAVTQFQACDARRAFPCFDEPALKARFSVILLANEGVTCLSNMDIKRSENDVNKIKFQYNTTPPMSTYLLAFAIGEFHYVEVQSTYRLPIRVYTTMDRDVAEGTYAAEVTAKGMAFYEEKFGIKYPLPKLDLVGVAAKQGAMENWGLILFTDRALLENKESTSAAAKEVIANVTLHEEAHLWFGDLVTMEWWNGLWLNESFADWVSLYAVNTFYPNWQTWNNFITTNLNQALQLDALRSSHPIEVEVKRTGQINQLFDAITYQKGSSVLRMLATHLGEDVFVDGVRRYIQAHAYRNTKTADLWEKLTEASGQDVETLMQPWTKQVGYPIITVTEDARTNLVSVKQNRYLSTGDVKPEDDVVLWPIFLGTKTTQGTKSVVLTGREGHFEVPSLDFFKINEDHTGFYRTLYTPQRLMKLAGAAQKGMLSVADRAGLMSDAAAFSSSGHQYTSLTYYFAKSLLRDTSYFVWKQITQWITTLRQAWNFEPDSVKSAITALQLNFTWQKAHILGWNFDDLDSDDKNKAITDKFKQLMFTAAGFSGDKAIISFARIAFADFAAGDRSAVNANLRIAVFALAMRHGGLREYEQLLTEYRTGAKTTNERTAALGGMGHATSPDLIARNVALLFDARMSEFEIGEVMNTMGSHRTGAEALLDVILYRWEELTKRSSKGLGGKGSVLVKAVGGLATEEQAARLEAAFESRDANGLDKQLAQQLELIRVRARWVERSREDVEAFLASEGYLE